VLVDERRPGAGVAQACHQLLGGGTKLGGQRGPGVAQVVKVHIAGKTGRLPGTGPDGRPVRSARRASPVTREEQSVEIGVHIALEVLLELGDDENRQSHATLAGRALGRGVQVATSAELDELTLDDDLTVEGPRTWRSLDALPVSMNDEVHVRKAKDMHPCRRSASGMRSGRPRAFGQVRTKASGLTLGRFRTGTIRLDVRDRSLASCHLGKKVVDVIDSVAAKCLAEMDLPAQPTDGPAGLDLGGEPL